METPRPFWKPGILWLVIGLPLASIVAGIGLLVVATRSGGTDVVPEQVRRVSQIQTTDLGPDSTAARLGLSAVLRAQDGMIELIPVSGDMSNDAPLRLSLQHPSRSRDDLELALSPMEGVWRASHAIDHDHDWIVRLAAADGRWRLHGRLPRQQHATRLAPSIGP